MRSIARFMDARNTAEGKFLSVLLSVLLVFSFLNVGMFTDQAGAVEEANSEFVDGEPNDSMDPQNETVVPGEDDSDEDDSQGSDTNKGVNEEPASQEGIDQKDGADTLVVANELTVENATDALQTSQKTRGAAPSSVVPLANDKNYTIKVGVELELEGKESSQHKWSAYPSGIVSLDEDDDDECEITGKNPGTVTITHEYVKNGNWKSETFQITVVGDSQIVKSTTRVYVFLELSDPNNNLGGTQGYGKWYTIGYVELPDDVLDAASKHSINETVSNNVQTKIVNQVMNGGLTRLPLNENMAFDLTTDQINWSMTKVAASATGYPEENDKHTWHLDGLLTIQEKYNVKVNYAYHTEDGEPAPNLPSSINMTVKAGDSFSKETPVLQGYVADRDRVYVEHVMGNQEITVTYHKDRNNNGKPDCEERYTVTYKAGDHGSLLNQASAGEVSYSDILLGSSTPQAPELKNEPGWTFKEWSPAIADTVTEDATYTAQWVQDKYTVEYQLNGGMSTTEQLKYTDLLYGNATPKIANPTRDGWVFNGWNPNVPDTVTGSAVYQAQWNKGSFNYTVNYLDAENGQPIRAQKTGSAEFESTVQSSDEIVDIDEYVFDHAEKDSIAISHDASSNVINLYYEKDASKDGVPDKYQAFVEYKVVGGFWDAALKTVSVKRTVDLYKKNSEGVWVAIENPDLGVPAPATPDTGFSSETGAWDSTPSVDQLIPGGTKTFTYSFSKFVFTTTVKFIDDSDPAVTIQDSITSDPIEYGSKYDVSSDIAEEIVFNGARYILEGVDSATSGDSITSNIEVTARYTRDANNDGVPDKYQATVTFRVQNGSFKDDFEDRAVQVLNFKTYNDVTGVWEDSIPELVVPENEKDMTAETGYHVGDQPWGENNPVAVTIEPGKPYEFTYTYDINQYTLTVEVENGSVKPAGSPMTVDHGSDQGFSFEGNEGYALDTVTVDGEPAVLDESGAYTFENIQADRTIKVVYAGDKIGTKDPDEGDGIPDKYQATVTYKVVNGTWDGESSADQVKVFSLKEKDPNGVWTELNPKLGGTVPTGMTALPAYSQNTGEWIDGTPVSDTPVTGNATYTYSYGNEMNKYKVTVEVENGTADSVSPIEVVYGSNKTIKFNGNEGYALDTVTVDGEPAVLDESGAYTFENIQADRTIKVVYAGDKIGTKDPDEGDGVPDKYQATVTYKVVNGTWSDDTDEPQKNVFTIFEKNDNGEWNSIEKKLGGTVPTGMKPSQNYDANSGKWGDPAPTDATVVTQSTTYEYKFGLNKYTATVKYVDDSTAANKLAEDVVTDPIEHGQSYDVTNQIRASIDVDGTHYVLDTITGTVSGEITTDVTVTAVYAEDTNNDGVPDKYEAAVTYKVKNGTWDGVVSSDKVEHFVLATKNADNTWTPTNAVLGNTIPTGMQALPAYSQSQDKGAWDVSIKDDTPVVGDAIYTYSFGDELNSYPIDVTVVNGVANVELLAVENGHIQVMAEYGDDFVPSFAPAEGFALDAVTVDGQPAVLDANGAYEFKGIDGAHSITVTYAANANDDNIPDKYQATIVYTVDHGTWADLANEPIRNTVSFAQYNGETGQWDAVTPALPTVPTGMIPDAGYDQIGNGHWLVTPSMNGVQPGGTYTFPYSFDINTYGIDVRVVNGTSDAAAVGVTANYGDSRTYTFRPFAGYALDTVTVDGQVAELTDGTYTFSDIQGDHSIVATYAADANGDGVPDQYQAIANYNVVNGTWSNGTTTMISEYVDMFRYENGAWAAIQPVLNVPTGMIANDGYTQASGAWSVNPAVSQLVAGRAVTFTYGFTATPTVVVPPVTPVTPPTPPVTPAAVTPAPTPAPAPAPAPAAAPAAATPAPAATTIDDEATPLAFSEGDEEQIADDGTPMGAFDEPHCWVHWVMLIGIILTAVYGILVVRRRLTLTSDIDDYEDQILGRVDDAQAVPAHAAGHQAL